jgi:hypothetical protein
LSDRAVEALASNLGPFVRDQLLPVQRRPLDIGGVEFGRLTLHQELSALPDASSPESNGAAEPRLVGKLIKDGSDPVQFLLAEVDSSSHGEVVDATRPLDQALHVLRIANEEHGIDSLTAPQIAQVLKGKFRLNATRQGIQSALDRASTTVNREPRDGAIRYRIMAAGMAYLRDPDITNASVGSATHRPRRKTSRRRDSSGEKGAAVVMQDRNLRRPPGRPSPAQLVRKLVEEGFFASPRQLFAVQHHLEESGYRLKNTDISPIMTRLIRDAKLTRVKNTSGQYEYSAR